jgi:undecaprenyl-diphosphatase
MSGAAERWVTELGARPLVLLALLIVLATAALGIVAATVTWAARRARTFWRAGEHVWRWLEARWLVRRLEARFPSVWRALRALDPDEYLVLHGILGLTLTLAALVFVGIADEIAEGSAVVRVDDALAASLHDAASPQGVAAFRALTFFGGTPGLYIVSTIVTVILLWKRQRLLTLGWLFAMIGVAVLNAALKVVFARPRPWFESPHEIARGFSFPSGHAMATIVAAGMLAYFGVIAARGASGRAIILACAVAWTVAMGFSRMYLGVHYLSDVLGGFAAGTVWLSACISGLEIARRAAARRGQTG